GEFDEVPMSPHSWINPEVALMVAAAVITPEAQRHRRHWRGHYQLALTCGRVARFVPGLHTHPESRSLDVANVHRKCRGSSNKDGGDVGASAHGGQPDITHMRVDPAIPVGRER